VIGTLEDIVEKSASLKAPALIVVGDVVRLAQKLDWLYADAVRYRRNFPGTEEELSLRF
jgi:precorrin-4 methylase